MLTRTLFAGIFATASICAVSAAELYTAKSLSEFQRLRNVSFKGTTLTGKGVFQLTGNKTFKIDPAKKYRISATVKCVSGQAGNIYLGFKPLDAKNRQIMPRYACNVKNTFTELVAPAKKGDKVIKVKNAAKWETKHRYSNVAFNAKADFSDLPNFEVTRSPQNGVVKKGDIWEIKLSEALPKAYPAGTKIRQQKDSSTFIYALVRKVNGSKEQKFTATVSGHYKDTIGGGKFWPGTKSVNVILLHLGASKDAVVEIKDLKLEEL